MPGNRRGNNLKESAPVFDDRAHASARPSRGKGRRNFLLAEPVAEHEKPGEIGEPDIVRIDGVAAFKLCRADSLPAFGTGHVGSLPAFEADDAGGPPAFRNRPRSGQCGNALFATHGGEGLGPSSCSTAARVYARRSFRRVAAASRGAAGATSEGAAAASKAGALAASASMHQAYASPPTVVRGRTGRPRTPETARRRRGRDI